MHYDEPEMGGKKRQFGIKAGGYINRLAGLVHTLVSMPWLFLVQEQEEENPCWAERRGLVPAQKRMNIYGSERKCYDSV